MAKVRAQLEALKEVAATKPSYSVVEVGNGKFCKLPEEA